MRVGGGLVRGESGRGIGKRWGIGKREGEQ